MQGEDGKPWTFGVIIVQTTNNHNGRSYKLRVTKTGCAIKSMKEHIKYTNISAEDYL